MDIDAGGCAGRATSSRTLDRHAADSTARVEATTDRRESISGRRLRGHHLPAGRARCLRARHRDPAEATASGSASATRSGRAASSAPCAPSRSCSTSAADMDELAPDALLLNYVNPMAPNCWAVDVQHRPPARGPLPQRPGDQRDAGRLARRALRGGHLPLRRHQPPGVLPRVPARRGRSLPGDPGRDT